MTSNIKFQTLQSSPPTVRSVRFKSRYFTLIIILFFSIWLLFGLLSISHVDVTSFVWTPKQSSLSRFTNNKISNFVKKIESVFPDLMHQIEGTLHEETLSKISRHRQNQNNDKLPLQTQSTIASEKSSTSIKDINIHQKSKKPFVERGINHSGSGSQQYLSSFYNMDPAVLVVGGTDGSGTRRVVQVLCQLGVPMVSEDPETYDIHADIIGGWPVVAHPLLQTTKGLNYDITNLPTKLLATVSNQLKKILDRAASDSTRPESETLAVGGVLRKSSHLQVREVKYGFKAPVAMVFVPLWAHLLPRFKFLHVVRDGRDIAFSANQGPVDKFFMDMYQSTGDINLNMPMPVKGIKLWSDWNSEIQNWSSKTFQRQLEVESRPTYLNTSDTLRHNISKQFSKYDYFVLHSENLVHESVSTRFITLYRLAQWLGSNASMNDICCLAHDDSEFLGSHDRTDPNQVNDRQLKKRYGKWRQFPDKNILAQLHSVGQNGLQLFGYEQTTNTTYSSTTASATANTPHNDGSNMLKLDSLPIQSLLFRRSKHTSAHEKSGEYDCAIKPHICPVDVFASAQPAVHPAEAYAAQNKCQIQIGTDYKSQDISTLTVVKTKPEDCCLACVTTPGCHYFTLNVRNSMCYLKGEKGQIITNDSTLLLVSGILR